MTTTPFHDIYLQQKIELSEDEENVKINVKDKEPLLQTSVFEKDGIKTLWKSLTRV